MPARRAGGWARTGALAAITAGLVLTPLACRDILGIEERSSEGLGGGGGEDPVPGGACNLGLFSTVPDVQCRSCLTSGITSCCGTIDACAADEACVGCLRPDGACPSPAPATYEALVACVRGNCTEACYPEPTVKPDVLASGFDLAFASPDCVAGLDLPCHPTTPSPTCNWQAGAACDISPRKPGPADGGTFACYLSNRRHIGEPCGLVEGMCHFGLTCANYRCARFCCANGDCDGGWCDPAWIRDYKLPGFEGVELGICVKGTAPGPGE